MMRSYDASAKFNDVVRRSGGGGNTFVGGKYHFVASTVATNSHPVNDCTAYDVIAKTHANLYLQTLARLIFHSPSFSSWLMSRNEW